MAVTETSMAVGSWAVRLRANTPKEILNALVPFGHIAVMPGRLDVKAAGDGLLRAARYVGVYRSLFAQPEDYEIKGAGMAFWLGDEDNKGYVFRTTGLTLGFGFANAMLQALGPPPAVTLGTIYPPTPDPNISFQRNLKTPRELVTYLCTTYGTSTAPVEWRINGDASVDAGVITGLYPSTTNPQALLVRRDGGKEIGLSTVEGSMSLDIDATDTTTQIILAAEGSGGGTYYATASAALNPYKDLFGNPVNLTRIVSESDVPVVMAPVRAQINLAKYQGLRYATQLSTDEYDVKGTFRVGDTIYVHDVDAGFIDPGNQVMYHGVPLNPYRLRVTEMTWPIPAWWTVAYRDPNGVWYDLSDYYAPEQGSTSVTVGEFLESVGGSYSEPVGSRPNGDSSVPNTPVFGTITTSAYQSDTSRAGDTKAQINATWSLPTNADGSAIVDGGYYRLRYRAKFATGSDWTETMVSWGTTQTVITELTPGTTYSLQIRAEDIAVPPNVSAWSATTDVVSAFDALAPSTPAAPSVAASRIAIQVTHTLGKQSGGTYNLETDLDHLEVHAGASSGFTTASASLLGRMTANVGLMQAGIAAVGTFNIESTAASWIKVVAVDRSGNKSASSTGASATALLIDNAHISDLTVSKVTAGTIGATWIVGGTIATATSGARVEMVSAGINAYNSSGSKTVEILASTGKATFVGSIATGFVGGGSPFFRVTDTGDRTTIDFLNSTASTNLSAFMNSPQDSSSAAMIGINTGTFTYLSQPSRHRLFLSNDSGIALETIRTSTGNAIGGQLLIQQDQAYLQVKNASSVVNGGSLGMDDAALRISVQNSGTVASELALFDTGGVWLTGRMTKDNAISGQAAVYSGSFNDNAGGGTIVVGYGTTMGTIPWPILNLMVNDTTARDHHMKTATTTNWSFFGPNLSCEYTYFFQRLI